MLAFSRLAFVAVVLGCLACVGASGSFAASAPRVTIVSDSVGGVLFWQRDAREELALGIDLRMDIRTCRRLATEGCVYDGARPPSALEAIKELGRALGAVAVVDVGYNDAPDGYGAALDRVMRALLDNGVEHVVWLTLRERRSSWADINDEIHDASKRWPQLVVGEWDRESSGHDEWFADGIHMNWVGGAAFGRFLRPLVVQACAAACAAGGSILAVGGELPPARLRTRYVGHLRPSGGAPPYRLTVTGLPAPLRMKVDGTIYGMPKAIGAYPLQVTVLDANGIRNRATVALRVRRR